MEQLKAIAVLLGGVVSTPKGFRTATYEERDAFGILGGRARAEATALLADRFPAALILALHSVLALELAGLGVPPERIRMLEPEESSSFEELRLIADQAKKLGRIGIVSNEYHVPRIRAFWNTLGAPEAQFISAESVLMEADPSFAEKFEKIKRSPAYKERLAAEARGLAALENGTYQSAAPEDKKERGV